MQTDGERRLHIIYAGMRVYKRTCVRGEQWNALLFARRKRRTRADTWAASMCLRADDGIMQRQPSRNRYCVQRAKRQLRQLFTQHAPLYAPHADTKLYTPPRLTSAQIGRNILYILRSSEIVAETPYHMRAQVAQRMKSVGEHANRRRKSITYYIRADMRVYKRTCVRGEQWNVLPFARRKWSQAGANGKRTKCGMLLTHPRGKRIIMLCNAARQCKIWRLT